MSVEGFNPHKVSDYSKGIELTLGAKITKAIVFDRDYRSDEEINALKNEISPCSFFVHIHRRKEIENYLLEQKPIERAIKAKLSEQNDQTGGHQEFKKDVSNLLIELTEALKNTVAAQYQTRSVEYAKKIKPGIDSTTLLGAAIEEFEKRWSALETRLSLVPGKEVLSLLNTYLQEKYHISITPKQIIA